MTAAVAGLLSMASFASAPSDSSFTELDTSNIIEQLQAYRLYEDSLNSAINYQRGRVDIGSGIATLNVPEGYKYVGAEQSDYILTEVWGNPPGQNSLGMILPEDQTPFTDGSYAIIISYSEEGYVDDDDAQDLDYDDLLETMQEDTKEWSKQRIEMGYPPIELMGWASKPFYDSEAKKLHWAKELQFGDLETRTLNYDIRILGRKGYLELNFIGDLGILPTVKSDMNDILASVNFNEGYRYSDFNPDLDEVAAYGIGGLIAGKVLAKVGFFAVLLKFWKLIAIGAVAAFAAFKKFLGFRKKEDEEPNTPAAPPANPA